MVSIYAVQSALEDAKKTTEKAQKSINRAYQLMDLYINEHLKEIEKKRVKKEGK